MPEGDFRRPPLLWEQKIANLVAVNAVGSVSGGGTTEVGGDLPPGDGGPPPGDGADPILPTPAAFSMPSTPTLTGGVQSLMVTWDGLTAAGDLFPYESAVVEVHQSTTTGFTPSASTLKGELRYPGNFTITGLTAGTTYYFRLRGRDAAGNYTTASAQASGTTGLTTTSDYGTATIDAGAVSFNARQIGGITTTVGATAPTSPVTGDIWLDSSSGAIVHKRWNGSSWVTQAWGSDSLSANCITATQIAAGAITAGAIAADAVTAAKISGDAIDGKTITGATFRTSATAGTGTAPRAGIIIDTAGLRGFDASGNQTININASTGAVTISGNNAANLITGSQVNSNVTSISGGAITTGTVSAARIDAAILRATDVGSGGTTTIDGGRITTGTVSADRIDVANLTVQKLTSGPFSSRRVVIGEVGATDGVQFKGANTSNGWTLSHNSGNNGLSLSTNYSGVDFTIVPNVDIQTSFVAATKGVNRAFRVDSNGDVFSYGIDGTTTSSAANVRVEQTGSRQLVRSTSTQRVKTDIVAVRGELEGVDAGKLSGDAESVDPWDVLNIAPAEFQSLAPVDQNQRLLGFIAENVATVFPFAAEWDEDGIPSSVSDRPILAALLAVVKDQQATIADLTARVTALESA